MNLTKSGLLMAAVLPGFLAAQTDSPLWKPFWDLARETRPEFRASSNALDAVRFERDDAARWENPQLEVEAEGLGGGEHYEIRISQELPWSGRKAIEGSVAQVKLDTARAEQTLQRLNLGRQVADQVRAVQTADAKLVLWREAQSEGETFFQIADARVKAGQASGMELTRARLHVQAHGMELEQMKLERAQALEQLASLCGVIPDRLPVIPAMLESLPALPPRADWEHRFLQHPALQLAEQEVTQSVREAELAKRERLPDVALTFGIQDSPEEDQQTYLAGIGIPLPLWKPTGPSRGAAEARVRQHTEQRDALALTQGRLLQASYGRLVVLQHRVEALSDSLIPMLTRQVEQGREGYREGTVRYLELVDAMKEVRESKMERMVLCAEFAQRLFDYEFVMDGEEQ